MSDDDSFEVDPPNARRPSWDDLVMIDDVSVVESRTITLRELKDEFNRRGAIIAAADALREAIDEVWIDGQLAELQALHEAKRHYDALRKRGG